MNIAKSLHFQLFKTGLRLSISSALAFIFALLLPNSIKLTTKALCIWDFGMVSYLVMTWLLMAMASPSMTRSNALKRDEGRFIIASIIVASACASILSIAFTLRETKGLGLSIELAHLALAGLTIVGSWLMVHTVFAMQYSRAYYRSQGGLIFPDCFDPDYWDFLYFSFIIGMTSQVSDIQISSSVLRRLALSHGIFSFFFNTAIVAMSINLVAGLIQ